MDRIRRGRIPDSPEAASAAAGAGLHADRVITALAARQHGVVSRRQLVAAGLSKAAIDHRVDLRLLRPVHRGVYLFGPVVSPNGRAMAACLAAGPTAVLSHRSAASAWQMGLREDPATPVEVIVRGGERTRPGLRIRRIRTVRAEEVTLFEGIPVTTPARTLQDLAGSVGRRELERALAEAFARRLITHAQLERLVQRHAGRRGARALRAVLDAGPPALTRSEAEERLLELVRKARLARPEVNARVRGHEVDFVWRKQRLVVEVDGFAFHSSPRAFERDRRRDADLAVAGVRVVRVTWRQIEKEPEAVVAQLAQALAATHGLRR